MSAASALVATEGQVNFYGAWQTFWGRVSGNITGLITLLTIVGVLLLVIGIVGYIFEKRKSGGGSMSQGGGKVMWAMIAGLVCVAPNALIPLILKILDGVANGVLSILG